MSIFAFLSYVIITSITPGPSNLLIMNESKQFGFRGSWKFSCGILIGFAILGVGCSVFTTSLQSVLPAISPILELIGAGYLIYLAWKIGTSNSTQKEHEAVKSTFQSGIVLQIMNVKSILFFITVLSTFILPHHTSIWAIALYTVYAILLGWIALLLWAAFGSLFSDLFKKHDLPFRLTMSALLIYSAIEIF